MLAYDTAVNLIYCMYMHMCACMRVHTHMHTRRHTHFTYLITTTEIKKSVTVVKKSITMLRNGSVTIVHRLNTNTLLYKRILSLQVILAWFLGEFMLTFTIMMIFEITVMKYFFSTIAAI